MRRAPGSSGFSSTALLLPLLAGFWLGAAPPGAAAKGPELVLQTGHSDAITSAALSADGKRVLTGSEDETAILWDAGTGLALRSFKGHSGSVYSAALSSDGKRVLTRSGGWTVILWDAVSGEQLRSFKGHSEPVNDLVLSSDGNRVLTGSDDKTAVLWDAASGDQLRIFKGHQEGILSVALSGDGKRVLSASRDKTAILWDAATGDQLRIFKGHKEGILSVALSGDGKRVLTGSYDKTAILWDADSGEQIRIFTGQSGYVHSVALSSDGKRALTGSMDQTAILWDTANGEQLRALNRRSDPNTRVSAHISVALSRNGERFLVGFYDSKTITLWDAASGEGLCQFKGRAAAVTCLALDPEMKGIVTGCTDNTAVFWPLVGSDDPRTFKRHTKQILDVALAADANRLVTSSEDKSAIVWDLASAAPLRFLKGHTEDVSSVALSRDGKRVLTGSCDKTAILWDAPSGDQLRAFKAHNDEILHTCVSVALTSDSKKAITGSAVDFKVLLWDAETGERLRTFDGHTSFISTVVFSVDGKRVLSGSADHTAILWDATNGKQLRSFKGHTGRVTSVALSSDGRRTLTGSSDNTAILWDAFTGDQIRVFKGHTSDVRSVALSSDGKRAFTASRDGTTRLWDADTGKELCALISLDAGQDWLVVTPSGLFDGSAGGRQKVMYRIGDGLNVVPVDRFFQDFYRPGLLAAVMKGDKIKAPDFASSKPPTVRIVSPKDGGSVEKRDLMLETEVTDEGGGIQGPWLFLNGARLAADATTSKDGRVVKRAFKVSLVEGDNRFEVKAACGDGSWDSEPALITLRYEKPLDKPVLHVVAIGVSKYAEGSFKLKFASDDARAMARLFDERGKALYREVKVTTLLDAEATRDKIRATLKAIPQKAQVQDSLVLFVAGHGTLVGQRYYYIPHDFKVDKDKSKEDNIRQQGLPADELADFISAGPALKRILILDTCASGGAVDLFKVALARGDPFAFRGEIERMSRSQGIWVLAASAATEEAKEPEALGHGVLTYTLLAGMRAVEGGPLERKGLQPSGKEQVVEVLEWFNYAQGHVRRLTKEYCGQEQNAQIGGPGGSSFPLLPLR